MGEGPHFIDAARIDALLDYPSLVEALAEAHRTGVDAADRVTLEQPTSYGAPDHFLSLPAWQAGRALGAKLATSFPRNLAKGLPSVHAVYVLFEGGEGRPVAVLDGTAMTPWKTAADSALGAKLLAREEAGRLLMVGAGVMAPALIRAHLAVRPAIEDVAIWNRNHGKARRLAEELKLPGVRVSATEDLEAAARAADVISCATGATEPLVLGQWLKPGAHLDLVGGYMPEMREADDEAVRRARVFVDSRWFTLGQCGDLVGPMESGAITEADVIGDLFQLCRGEVPGRRSNEEITLFKNGGGGHLDLMTAMHIVERAPAV